MPEAMSDPHGFQPAWVSPPGETIADVLRARNLPITQFADAMEQTVDDVIALLEGRTTITIALARRLSEVLGPSVQFWMSRDYLYRQGAGRLQAEHRDWLDALPMGDMIRFGWIAPTPRATEEASAALRFFGVPSVQAWHQAYGHIEWLTAFRTSAAFDSSAGAVAAWVHEGERRAAALSCAPWDPDQFRDILSQVRALSRIGDPQRFLPRLQELCASGGVAVIPLRPPTGCRASGATRFLSADKALILVSFRHLSDDHFWYTFFHEAGHLLLHGPSDFFVEGLGEMSGDVLASEAVAADDLFSVHEREAHAFASRTLIPEAAQPAFRALRADATAILRFASEVGISPGIVVGQLQYLRRLRQNQLNTLKRRYTWTEDGAVVRQARQPRKAR
jgi:HTH-type transcriptional regulator/antitoxin HigA